MQTSLGRTDIVRWFKDHRSALKNGETLDWMEGFQGVAEKQKASQEQNGQSSEKNKCISLEIKAVKVDKAVEKVSTPEQSKQPEQDKVQRLTDRLADGVTDLSRTRPDQNSSNATEKGRWVKVTLAVGEDGEGGAERQRLATDTDILTLEQPGRVTG